MNTPTSPVASPIKPPSSVRTFALPLVLIAGLGLAGWNAWRQWPREQQYSYKPGEIAFVDHALSNAAVTGTEVGDLKFTDADGKPVDLQQYRRKKNVVLVVTRGSTSGGPAGQYTGKICIYCSTQTSRLIANYESIRQHDAEVVVVFPIEKTSDAGQLTKFREAVNQAGSPSTTTPFPLVLDPELRAVDQLGIRQDLSKPATYILDKEGQVRFAYVGKNIADRPSVQSILEQLAAIKSGGT